MVVARAVARETRMRSERAWFLDRRERRANDESSPFSALGENGRGFEATDRASLSEPPRNIILRSGVARVGEYLGGFTELDELAQ
jgi:hypothetical protein